jgi:hypothetical protein
MLVFIDDSGDAGFKLQTGSSRFFIIACIIFGDELEAEKTAVAIKELKRRQKIPLEVEYKFTKCSKEKRIEFFHHINTFKFRIRLLVINKSLIRSKQLIESKECFYSYAIKSVLKYSRNSIINAKIRIDGSGDKAFRKSFMLYLRKQLNSQQKKVIHDCKLVDSKSNVLIQLADMIAGAIRRYYDVDKTDRNSYKSIFQKHIEDEWYFC